MDTVIRNGLVVTASDTFAADVGILKGRIAHLGDLSGVDAGRVIDASDRYVLPGGVDIHTHLDTPSFGTTTADDYLTGTIAAACGGTTSIVDFCQQERGQSLADAIAAWHARARGKAAIDYGFHSVIIDPTDAVIDELGTLPDLGVTSFKVFLAYKGMNMVDDDTLIRALQQARRAGCIVMVHAENGDAVHHLQRELVAKGCLTPEYHATSRPPRVEAEATARAIALAEVMGASVYIVHVSCGEALEEVTRGRARGVDVRAETCTQYLYTSEEDLSRPDFEGGKFVFTPPPRPRHNQEVLWRALADGDLQVISSDHSPWNWESQKQMGREDFTRIPNGAPGIEERMMLVFQGVRDGRLSLSRFVDITATTPARVFGMYPQKGTIAIGSDADLVIWDPARELTLSQKTLHQNVDYTLYEGMTVTGVPSTVLLRGKVIVDQREFVGTSGFGRYVHRRRSDTARPV